MHLIGGRQLFAILIVGLATALVSAPRAAADPPANDNFADAQTVGTLPATVAGTNVDATKETGEPGGAGGPFGFRSVWFKWTAAAEGAIHLDLCDALDSPRFRVYTGTDFSNLQEVVENSFWTDADCAQTFIATAATTYYIQVESFPDGGSFNLAMRAANRPANDDFANAQTIGPSLPATFSGTNLDATFEAGEPFHEYYGNSPTKSVWYRWVAPWSTEATLSRNCSGGDTDRTITIYTGTSLADLQQVVATVCFVTIPITKGATYWIAANSHSEGAFQFTLTAVPPPANDDFGLAQVLSSGLPSGAYGSTVYSSAEPGEPDHFSGLPAFTSVWYLWTATTTGLVLVETCNSSFDPVLAVYQGANLGGLAQIASNDDSAVCDAANQLGSAVVINAVAGTEYRVAVDGYDEGSFQLGVTSAGPQTSPQSASPPPVTSTAGRKRSCRKAKAAKKKKCRRKPK